MGGYFVRNKFTFNESCWKLSAGMKLIKITFPVCESEEFMDCVTNLFSRGEARSTITNFSEEGSF